MPARPRQNHVTKVQARLDKRAVRPRARVRVINTDTGTADDCLRVLRAMARIL